MLRKTTKEFEPRRLSWIGFPKSKSEQMRPVLGTGLNIGRNSPGVVVCFHHNEAWAGDQQKCHQITKPRGSYDSTFSRLYRPNVLKVSGLIDHAQISNVQFLVILSLPGSRMARLFEQVTGVE
jgi:ABC-type cobalt transport system substrate-binding protein